MPLRHGPIEREKQAQQHNNKRQNQNRYQNTKHGEDNTCCLKMGTSFQLGSRKTELHGSKNYSYVDEDYDHGGEVLGEEGAVDSVERNVRMRRT
ncbi:hypothetical protein HYALB_00003718 [Hymenoscyphus albidus]|uniref:Uncharacterized protein n=1 Tax=Hymenoscyphus albidus TaxID=595503 RepID=A0A9N9LVV3_9HELO|nr:hypothetical protein HYALB_00003718 [Hymenoscyphus albidus]